MKSIGLGLVMAFVSLLMVACNGEVKKSDAETIEKNVRNYFFLDDTVQVNFVVTDTIYSDELEEMLKAVEHNLALATIDSDTLSSMIDVEAYKKPDWEKEAPSAAQRDSVAQAEKKMLEYAVHKLQVEAIQNGYRQTNRLLMHLKRSTWANVSGYSIMASYLHNNAQFEVELLMDANLNVVD